MTNAFQLSIFHFWTQQNVSLKLSLWLKIWGNNGHRKTHLCSSAHTGWDLELFLLKWAGLFGWETVGQIWEPCFSMYQAVISGATTAILRQFVTNSQWWADIVKEKSHRRNNPTPLSTSHCKWSLRFGWYNKWAIINEQNVKILIALTD